MAERLTEQQRAAVEDRGRSLLVSAAAGSGKTKVLVERLFSHVERDGANLDEFLIITYTRAAAAEVRGKIAAALSERLRQDAGNTHLQRQMLRVYRADIKTVDAFCTALLRENCHLLGEDAQHRVLRPDFRVLDEQDAETIKRRVLARVLDRFYEGLDDGGRLLADTLGAGRDDRALAELVLEVHTKLQAQPDREAWLAAQRRQWEAPCADIDKTPYSGILLRAQRAKALHWSVLLEQGAAEMQQNKALREKYAPAFLSGAASLRALADACLRSWEDARSRTVDFPRLGSVRDSDGGALKDRMKRLWDVCKSSVKKQQTWFVPSGEEAAEDLRAMAPAMCALLHLVGAFSRAYQSEKRRLNAADFSDQEHEAIRLLLDEQGAPTELARAVSRRYREIMVDEYQDTNEVQNAIFSAISRDGKNLFTVGDVKQSIYRFRLADPRIFLRHYSDYPSAADAAEGESAKLVLTRNFRSRTEVLEATNFVFRNILSKEMGELDYGDDEALYAGASYEPNPACRTEFHLLSMPPQQGAQQRVSSAQAEAGFVARYVAQMLSGGFAVRDEATGEARPVRERDIVILMRSPSTRLAEYRRALESQGIRCAFDAGDDFFAAMETAVVFSLLQIVDNPRSDVPLIAVLRSPLFGFTPDRLAVLRAQTPHGDFYDALLADEGEDVRRFLDILHALRENAQIMSVYRLLFAIYDRCSVLSVFGAMRGGAERRENLLAFFSLAQRFEEAGHRGLFAFVAYLHELKENGAGTTIAQGSAEGVRIMSIHKSKGLEFPVVILGDLARAFSNMDFTGPVLVHPTYGLGPVCVDLNRRIRYPTLARDALEYALRRETKAEEMRLLYVAMTRAKEKLVLVHTAAGAAKHVGELTAQTSCPVLPEAVDEAKCLGDWVLLPLLCRPEAQPLRDLGGIDAQEDCVCSDAPWLVQVHDALAYSALSVGGEQEQAAVHPELPLDTEALAYRYPYAAAVTLPAKLTATQLKGRESDLSVAEHASIPPRLRTLARPHFVTQAQPLTAAERGTATHLAMQYLDFSGEATEEGVRAQLSAMAQRRLLTPEQAAAVDDRAIARFLSGELAARIRSSAHVEREYQFSILQSAREYAAETADDDAVLLQGVVDCFFEEAGKLVVVDFKTDRVTAQTSTQRAEEYRPQLAAYSGALSRIWETEVAERLLYFFATGETIAV